MYVSFESWDTIEKEHFVAIDQVFKSTARNYIIGTVKLGTLHNAEWFYDKNVSVIALGTGVITDGALVHNAASVLELAQ
ncbi:hypothetical protein D3C87_1612310 [compost metagenome]